MKIAQKRKLGIIGGAGPLASALFYQMLCKAHYRQSFQGEKVMPEVLIINYPFTRGLTLSESHAHKHLLCSELQYCIDALASQQVKEIAIACNTLHAFVDLLDLKEMQLFSIPQLVMEAALQQGMRRLLILATQTTRSYRLYCHPKLDTIFPNSEEQMLLDRMIDRILAGIINQQDSDQLSRLIEAISLREKMQAVVLGCTDLPVLHHFYPLKIDKLPLLDSIQIPAHKLINKI